MGIFFTFMSVLIGKEPIDLRLSLYDSAQCFHWTENEGRFGAVVNGAPVWVWTEDGDTYAADGADVEALREYLDLNRDYSSIADEYAAYEMAANAVRLYPGLRVLNQPTWDTLLSFIISANNNVSRIRSLVMKLCRAYGRRYDSEYGELYSFPEPGVLAGVPVEELRAMGMGYRDRYLVETAQAVANGFPLEQMRNLDYETAHKQLTGLTGVGDKVADCIQLFGCGHTEAFPVDVWIARMVKVVFGMEGENRRKLGRDAREMLGKNAGLLQQFLFHASRTGAIDV